MKRFRRQVRRNVRRKVLERMTARQQAEEYVFRFLEWRWKDKLRGQKIPEAHRKIMRRDPYFNMLVAKVLQGEGLALPGSGFHARDRAGTRWDRDQPFREGACGRSASVLLH